VGVHIGGPYWGPYWGSIFGGPILDSKAFPRHSQTLIASSTKVSFLSFIVGTKRCGFAPVVQKHPEKVIEPKQRIFRNGSGKAIKTPTIVKDS
jgi:hypothetical protein